MKVVAFNGTARAKGNTAVMVNAVLQFPEPLLPDRSDDRREIRHWENGVGWHPSFVRKAEGS